MSGTVAEVWPDRDVGELEGVSDWGQPASIARAQQATRPQITAVKGVARGRMAAGYAGDAAAWTDGSLQGLRRLVCFHFGVLFFGGAEPPEPALQAFGLTVPALPAVVGGERLQGLAVVRVEFEGSS